MYCLQKLIKGLSVISALILLTECSPNPYAGTNKSYKKQTKAFAKTLRQYPLEDSLNNSMYWVGTTNFNMRKPNFVIIHHTAQNSCEQTLKTFTIPKTQVSAHYVICKDGTIHHMLSDYLRAWQAGNSKWGQNTDINSCSIGIELDNNGYESFTELQISSLLRVLGSLKKNYNIPAANFIGHSDIAPGRKVDPNRNFPWQQLAENGYGLWYDTTGLVVPENFNSVQALRLIGYDVKDSSNAIYSFKLHFVQSDSTKIITEEEKKILMNLMVKYQ